MNFFDFLQKIRKEEPLKEVLVKEFRVSNEILQKLSVSFNLNKKGSELTQRELDKIFRILFDRETLQQTFFASKDLKEMGRVIKEKATKTKRKFYERWYYWTFTSDGFLVFRGKNQRQNLTILRRFVVPNDLLFFDTLENPVFTVLKVGGFSKPLPPITIYEAAEFACAYSYAWAKKLEKIEIFYTERYNVRVEKNIEVQNFRKIEKVKPKLSIGFNVKEMKIVYGPPTSVKKYSDYMVTVVPGDRDSKALAVVIKNSLLEKALPEDKEAIERINLREIQKIIPYGKGDLVK